MCLDIGSPENLLYWSILVLLLLFYRMKVIAIYEALGDIVRLLQDNAQLLQDATKSPPQTELPHFMPPAEGGEYTETSQWTGPAYKHFNYYVLQYRGKNNTKENQLTSPVVKVEAPIKAAKTPFRQNSSPRTQDVESHGAGVDHHAEAPTSKEYPESAYMMSRARPDEGSRPVYAPSDSSDGIVMDKSKHTDKSRPTPERPNPNSRNRKKKDRELR
ncbi:MAG: hypothetical protein Q9209_003725 [Squamulea sp. 1 TL-2023]